MGTCSQDLKFLRFSYPNHHYVQERIKFSNHRKFNNVNRSSMCRTGIRGLFEITFKGHNYQDKLILHAKHVGKGICGNSWLVKIRVSVGNQITLLLSCEDTYGTKKKRRTKGDIYNSSVFTYLGECRCNECAIVGTLMLFSRCSSILFDFGATFFISKHYAYMAWKILEHLKTSMSVAT